MITTRKPLDVRSMLYGALLAYAFILMLLAPSIRRANRPPLEPEFKEINKQTYRYFDANGTMPSDVSYLTQDLQNLVGTPNSGIVWHPAESKFTYDYPKGYPMNPSVLSLLTLGLYLGGDMIEMGSSITEESVRHNTPLVKAAGKL